MNSVTKAAEDAANKAREAADGVQGKLNEATTGAEGAAGGLSGGDDWSLNSLWAKAHEAMQKAANDVSFAHLFTQMSLQLQSSLCVQCLLPSCNQTYPNHDRCIGLTGSSCYNDRLQNKPKRPPMMP